MTLNELQRMFPSKQGNNGATGYIPMDFVNEHLDEIKQIVKENNLRRIYRGPRYDYTKAWTRREDAYAMVLYCK